ncbi:hypothetical protein GGU11DRAFT_822829 [Lentinula aff. detonsa]|nr:hypothetical protein GGU11DRAFT_822829 [Lentinula aff. detonsa]
MGILVFEWGKLPEGSKIVDVGGGVGSVLFPLAENFPELKLVIQDLPGVVDNARKFFTNHTSLTQTPAHVTLHQPQLLTRLLLDLRGKRYEVDRETIMNLPESVLLCLFPNGLVLSRQSTALDGGDGDEEDVYPVDFDPDCFQFVLSFFRNASEAFYGTATSPGLFSAQQHLLEAPLYNFSNLPICHPPSRPTPNESVLDSFGCALNPATTTQSPFLTYLSATHPVTRHQTSPFWTRLAVL